MLLVQKILIDAAPFSRSTYFRRKEELKIKIKGNGNFLSVDEARKVAEKMQYLEEFNEHIKTLFNGKY